MEITRFGKMVRVALLAATLAAAVVAGGASLARAAFVCTGDIKEVTIKSDVIVPAGAECNLIDSVVRGGLTLEPSADVFMVGGEIRGSVVATGHKTLDLRRTEVRGSVTATGGVDDTTGLLGVLVRGDVVFSGNVQVVVLVASSDVLGSVTVSDNTNILDPVDPIFVENNTIRVNLNCEGNSPAVEVGGNIVGGVASGQCAGS